MREGNSVSITIVNLPEGNDQSWANESHVTCKLQSSLQILNVPKFPPKTTFGTVKDWCTSQDGKNNNKVVGNSQGHEETGIPLSNPERNSKWHQITCNVIMHLSNSNQKASVVY